MNNKRSYNSKLLNNLIELDVLVTVLRLAFFSFESKTPSLKITYVQILTHLNLASFINKDRIKEALLTLLDVPFNIDGLEETPVISRVHFAEDGAGATVYFHSKVFLALKRGYFFDGLNYMPMQTVNREAKEKAIV